MLPEKEQRRVVSSRGAVVEISPTQKEDAMQKFIRIGEWFVSLDMPDPGTNWRQMAICILFVALVAVVMVAMLWAV